MTLGNMRELGVRSLAVTCDLCHHEASLPADRWPDAVLVQDFRPRMVCTVCGKMIYLMPGADMADEQLSQKLVQDIAKEGYAHALEILQLVEVMKRQNLNQVNANLSARGAARAAEMVRNSVIARITLLVAGAYSPARKGDKHVRRAFELLNSYPEIRATFLQNGFNKALDEAETLWRQLNADSRLTTVKHFRDKSTAHLAEPDPSVAAPKFRDFFAFAEDTASTPAFKAKVALAAIKGDRTLAHLRNSSTCTPIRSHRGRRSSRAGRLTFSVPAVAAQRRSRPSM